MDNIEQLLRDADPRRHRDSAGPLPLDLAEPGPVFAQQPVRQAPRPRRSWGPVALGAMVTAAAVAAVIFWSPWNAPLPEPGPAITPTPSPTAPSESSSANPTTPPESGALPNGLFPAYDGVHFADDQACRALSLPQLQVADARGKLSTPGYDTKAFAIIGCVQGFAAFTPSDQFKVEQQVEDTSGGMLIATWDPAAEHWVSSPTKLTDDGVEVHQEYLSWPLLRGFTYEADQTPEQRMNLAIKELGIDPEIVAELFGPNVPSWMETETGVERVPYGNSVLEVTHPAWTQYELLRDSEGKEMDQVTNDPRDAATYHLTFFDAHGKAVFNLAIFDDDRPGEDGTETCNDPAGTYTLNGLSPTSVVVDEGKLALGLITQSDYFGIERSAVSLVPADSAAQGKLCDLATAFHLNGKMVQSDAWTGYMGFKDAAERDTYLASSEYLRAQEVAASLRLK
ncbi:hypothetical protein [Paeniglutamicibacter sp. Y32M11]|uniref:hypothetical protein n=1 Tax=Paeniglutamicibacter sp. Y32M11 TaxID=2853258 RepID=UPI001C5310FC|nr:hypothetical protein [Paeniglutamicibacter sp. Y32M11]QXQ11441.1 hypothetical protein KUF55_06015 [Paeniglutamicibacter sp. Y32M11]